MQNGLIEVQIPWRVEEIEANAFRACSNLSRVTFIGGSDLRVIGRCAFHSCAALHELELNCVRELKEGCFQDSGLRKIVLPKKLQNVEDEAFKGCK